MGGGVGRSRGIRTRMPGSASPKSGSKLENPSRHFPHALTLDNVKGGYALCAQIYFRTGGYSLRPDDRGALHRTIQRMRTLLVNGAEVEVKCAAYADVRGGLSLNENLSRKRLDQVEHVLRSRLAHLKWCTIHPGTAHGERRSRNSPLLWTDDRRVDIWARAETEADRDARGNPWAKTRAEIFRRYSPVYHHWRRAGLDYLVDMYEKHDQDDYPVKIKSGDLESVYRLMMILIAESEQGRFEQWAAGGNRAEVISDWYCVEYRRAYQEAYETYQRQPNYGWLSPK